MGISYVECYISLPERSDTVMEMLGAYIRDQWKLHKNTEGFINKSLTVRVGTNPDWTPSDWGNKYCTITMRNRGHKIAVWSVGCCSSRYEESIAWRSMREINLCCDCFPDGDDNHDAFKTINNLIKTALKTTTHRVADFPAMKTFNSLEKGLIKGKMISHTLDDNYPKLIFDEAMLDYDNVRVRILEKSSIAATESEVCHFSMYISRAEWDPENRMRDYPNLVCSRINPMQYSALIGALKKYMTKDQKGFKLVTSYLAHCASCVHNPEELQPIIERVCVVEEDNQ